LTEDLGAALRQRLLREPARVPRLLQVRTQRQACGGSACCRVEIGNGVRLGYPACVARHV
jgi:hypothetical protein